MKNEIIVKFCNATNIFLLSVFMIKTIIDYINYSSLLNSAPFYVWVIVNSIYFLLPAIIIFIVGFITRKKK